MIRRTFLQLATNGTLSLFIPPIIKNNWLKAKTENSPILPEFDVDIDYVRGLCVGIRHALLKTPARRLFMFDELEAGALPSYVVGEISAYYNNGAIVIPSDSDTFYDVFTSSDNELVFYYIPDSRMLVPRKFTGHPWGTAVYIAEKFADQEMSIMCKLLINRLDRQTIRYPFGSSEFCNAAFGKIESMDIMVNALVVNPLEFQCLVNKLNKVDVLDDNKYLWGAEIFTCSEIPAKSILLLPAKDVCGTIGESCAVSAVIQSPRQSSIPFFVNAAYTIVNGETAGLF